MRTPRQYKVQGSRRSEVTSQGVTHVYDGYWWLIVPPGFCIVIVIAAAIFIGEGLRDAVEVGCSGAKAETETHGTAA